MRIETHAGKNAAHVGKALRNTWHRIVSVDLVFEVDPPPVANGDERKKDVVDRHDALADSDLATLATLLARLSANAGAPAEAGPPWGGLADAH